MNGLTRPPKAGNTCRGNEQMMPLGPLPLVRQWPVGRLLVGRWPPLGCVNLLHRSGQWVSIGLSYSCKLRLTVFKGRRLAAVNSVGNYKQNPPEQGPLLLLRFCKVQSRRDAAQRVARSRCGMRGMHEGNARVWARGSVRRGLRNVYT